MRTLTQAIATTRFKIAAIDRLLAGLSGNSVWCDIVTLSRADIACIPYSTHGGQQASAGLSFPPQSRDIVTGLTATDALGADAKHTRKAQRRARTALAIALTIGALAETKHLTLRELLNRCTTALSEAESFFKMTAPPVAPLLPERRNWRSGTYAWQGGGGAGGSTAISTVAQPSTAASSIASAASSISSSLSHTVGPRARRPSFFSRGGGARLRAATHFDGTSSRSTLGSSTGLAAVGFNSVVADGGDQGHGPHPLVSEDHFSVLQLPHFACNMSFGESCTAGVEAVRAIYLQVLDHLMNPSSLGFDMGLSRATTVTAAAAAVLNHRRSSLGRKSSDRSEKTKHDPLPPLPLQLTRAQTGGIGGGDLSGPPTPKEMIADGTSVTTPTTQSLRHLQQAPTDMPAQAQPDAPAHSRSASPSLTTTRTETSPLRPSPSADFVYTGLSYGLPYALTPSGQLRQPVSSHAAALTGALLEAFTRFDKAATKFCTAIKERLDDKAVDLVDEGLDAWLHGAMAAR